ncbi:uncharacterized protein V6R79_025545 [Siganus canaliculatus]
MDPSAKAPLGSQLSDQKEDTRERKQESEDPEEPRKTSRDTLSSSQGPSQQVLEDSNPVKRGNKRAREDSEEDHHVKKIKLGPSQGEDLTSQTGKQPEGPILISSSSSCFSKEKRCTCIIIDDSPSEGQNCSNAAVADSSGQQRVQSEVVTISSRDSFSGKDRVTASASCEGTSSKLSKLSEVKTNDHYSKVEFEAKYTKEKKIGQGAFGSVFAGYRSTDHVPFAIKYIPHINVKYTQHEEEGRVPLEVALMLRAKDVPAVITLLDWYDLGSRVVLVQERPEKCTDLFHYAFMSKGGLKEASMKNIMQQLVDAFVEIHSWGVLHRDLHLNNVLMELGSTVPRVRVIDFGFGQFTKSWQPLMSIRLSRYCKDFLSASLESETESSVQGLKCHPWLNLTELFAMPSVQSGSME